MDIPSKITQSYIKSAIKPGRVLYFECSFTNPTKNKYVMIASNKPHLLTINSKTGPYGTYVKLAQADHFFLSYDSYVDISKTHTEYDYEYIEELVKSNYNSVCVGKISTWSLINIRNEVEKSERISQTEIDEILIALDTELKTRQSP